METLFDIIHHLLDSILSPLSLRWRTVFWVVAVVVLLALIVFHATSHAE